jgi:hypothetical protein
LIFGVRRWKSVSRWLILTSALGSFDPKADFISKLGGARVSDLTSMLCGDEVLNRARMISIRTVEALSS